MSFKLDNIMQRPEGCLILLFMTKSVWAMIPKPYKGHICQMFRLRDIGQIGQGSKYFLKPLYRGKFSKCSNFDDTSLKLFLLFARDIKRIVCHVCHVHKGMAIGFMTNHSTLLMHFEILMSIETAILKKKTTTTKIYRVLE